MALHTGHHKTQRRAGTRNCFYCRKDVVKWQAITWPQIKALYEYCGQDVPSALCCDECYKKPIEELFKAFWGSIVSLECEKYRKKQLSIIKDDSTYKVFMNQLVESGFVEESKKWIEEQGLGL